MEKNSNFLGEQYREKSFIPDKYGNTFGCYNTFDTSNDFKSIKISTKNKKHLSNIKKMINSIIFQEQNDNLIYTNNQNSDFYFEKLKDIIQYNQFYYSKKLKLYMAWYLEGDGSLVFIDKNKNVFLNRDCKKDYNWQKVV